MQEAMTVLALVACTTALIRVGVYIGSRYIDRMLCFDPKNTAQPSTAPIPQERNT